MQCYREYDIVHDGAFIFSFRACGLHVSLWHRVEVQQPATRSATGCDWQKSLLLVGEWTVRRDKKAILEQIVIDMHLERTVMSILDSSAVSGCYLFPQPRCVADAFVVEVDGVKLACFQRVVNADAYTVVHFHGNGEAVADYVPDMTDSLASLGLNSLFVEFREYGGSTGKAQLVAMLGDGEAVVAAAGIPPGKVIAFGRSIGSLYAIELAHRQPGMAGLIIESGIADPAERFLAYADLPAAGIDEDEVSAEVTKYFNHQQKLTGYVGPLLIMHTENDGLIDISHAERNLNWAAGPEKRLLRFSRGDHNSIMAWNRGEYFEAIRTFAERLNGTD